MAVPSDKDPGIAKVQDIIASVLFGRTRTDSITSDLCVTCDRPATSFKDALSAKEYTISGMCQVCQDETFVEE